MDSVRLGSTFRAIRLELRLRQKDVAQRAGVSQQTISKIERGRLEGASLAALTSVAGALEANLEVTVRWRGPRLARLLDRRHALLQDRVAGLLRAAGWELRAEESFNHFGERGAVDLLGWRSDSRALLIVEIKSELVDLQETIRLLDVKARVLPSAVRRYGWLAEAVAAVLVLPDAHVHRTAVSRHEALLAASLPARTRAVHAWLSHPSGGLRGIWFLPNTPTSSARQQPNWTRRVSRGRKRHLAGPHAARGLEEPRPAPADRAGTGISPDSGPPARR